MNKTMALAASLILLVVIIIATGVLRKGNEQARVFFQAPRDGAVVSAEFRVRFGVSGMRIAAAGVNEVGTGHHHLLIDMDTLPDLNAPLPSTDQLRHFGKGQTETTLQLPPGEHTLQLLLGDFAHIPHDPPVISDRITITVE